LAVHWWCNHDRTGAEEKWNLILIWGFFTLDSASIIYPTLHQNAIQKEEKHKKNIVEEWGFNEGQQPRHIGSPLVVQSWQNWCRREVKSDSDLGIFYPRFCLNHLPNTTPKPPGAHLTPLGKIWFQTAWRASHTARRQAPYRSLATPSPPGRLHPTARRLA